MTRRSVSGAPHRDRPRPEERGLIGARRGRDDELFGEVLAHLRRNHPAMPFPEERVREFVTIRAYNLEYAAVYAEGEGLDEEFGPEPY